MAFVTPATKKAQKLLLGEFPAIKFGIYNRRKIAGSSTWSQHSWPNALDLFFTRYGDTSGEHQAELQEVHDWLRLRRGLLNIRTLLWQTRNHYDHIHIDFWPKGHGTPSTSRGGDDNTYSYPDGTKVSQGKLLEQEEDLAILTDEEQTKLRKFLDLLDNMESSVYFVIPTVKIARALDEDEPDLGITDMVGGQPDLHARSQIQELKETLRSV